METPPTRKQRRNYSNNPLSRPIDGDSPTRRQRRYYNYNIHIIIRPVDKIFPTQRQQQDFKSNIHTIIRSIDGVSPHSEAATKFSDVGISRTWRNVCTIFWWDFSHSEMLMETCPRAFLDCHTRSKDSKPSTMGFSPLKVSHYRDFPLRAPIHAPLIEFPPIGTRTLVYEILSSKPTGRWIHIYNRIPR